MKAICQNKRRVSANRASPGARQQGGYVLVTVIVFAFLIAAIAFLLGNEVSISTNIAAGELERDELRYVTEAGLRHAQWAANNSECESYDLGKTEFGPHSYTATFTPASGSPVTLTATGTLTSGAEQSVTVPDATVFAAAKKVTLRLDPTTGQDTYLVERNADLNYGAGADLRIKQGPQSRRSLLRFELGAVPGNSRVVSATLELKTIDHSGSAYVDAYRLTNSWVEGTNTGSSGSGSTWLERDTDEPWQTPGGDFDPQIVASTLVEDPVDDWYQWDITTLVDSWVNGGVTNNGLILIARDGLNTGRFLSGDDSSSGQRPRLTVSYVCECGVECLPGDVEEELFCDADFVPQLKDFEFGWPGGTDKVTGIDYLPEGTIVNGETIPAGGGWIISDEGVDAIFVTDADGLPLTDFSIGPADAKGLSYVESGTWTGHLAVADKGADAIYFLDLDGNTRGSISTALIAEEPFGLTFIANSESGIFDNHLAFTSKKNGGGEVLIVDQGGVLKKTIDIDSFAAEPQGVAQLPRADKLMVVDKDGLVTIIDFDGSLLNQYTANTWGFKNMRGTTIHPLSCEHVILDAGFKNVTGLQPAEESGGGNARVLMVVDKQNNLSSQETKKKSLMESWGHTVTAISDDESNATYATALAAADVVFVGEDVSAGQVGNKLNDALIGVVTEEANLVPQLGLATSVSWSSGSQFNVVNNNHYITQPFATGPLPVLDASADLADLSGTVASGVNVLGSTTAGPMLVTLEATAPKVDSTPSDGRRVLLPWGGSNFDVDELNADGLTVFSRALEWGVQPPPRCDADFVATTLASEFAWMPGTGDIHGIDYLPAGLVVNTVTIPAGGGWIFNDKGEKRLFVTNAAGTPLTDFPVFANDTQGIALVDGGPWRHRLALADKNLRRIFYVGLDGSIAWSFAMANPGNNPLGVAFVGATGSGSYDNSLVVSSDKNLAGDGSATLYLHDQWGALLKTIDVEAYAPDPQGVTHVVGADKFIVADKAGLVSVIDFDGVLLHQYSAAALGQTELNDIAVDPFTCDHVVINKGTESIGRLERVTGSGQRYVAMNHAFELTTPNSWQTINAEIYGVEPNSVLEIAVINTDGNRQWGGVRAVGSGLQRRMQLHEATGGGMEVMTLHVQADADGKIELYAGREDRVRFLVLGYWPEARYEENWQVFKAGGSFSWRTHSLSSYGVAAGDVSEIVAVNKNTSSRRYAGARTAGSSLLRVLELHPAMDGGSEVLSGMTTAGSGASIEVFAQSNTDIDFYLAGFFSTPPGTYTASNADLGGAALADAWHDKSLAAYGVPANAVAEIVMANQQADSKTVLGLRGTGAAFSPWLELHKPELGGAEAATQHVTVDAARMIQWYDKDLVDDHRFYLLGWWVLD